MGHRADFLDLARHGARPLAASYTLTSLAIAVTLLLPCSAHAQEPFRANDYAIDIYSGPVLASGRIVGMGGAFSAIGEGVDAAPWSPAAYATRSEHETSWFEWELAFGLLLPGAFSRNDFDNSGDGGFAYDEFVFLNFGFRLQFGDFGLGSLVRLQTYRVDDGSFPADVALVFTNYGVAYSFARGQLVAGVGGRTVDLSITAAGTSEPLVSFTGTGLELGALYRPEGERWRLGMSGRLPVESVEIAGPGVTNSGGVERIDRFVLPREVHMPWEISLGAAVQLGPRAFNRPFENPHDVEEEIALEVRRAQYRREQAQILLETGDQVRAALVSRGEVAPAQTHVEMPPMASSGAVLHARDPVWLAEERLRRAEDEREIERRIEAAEQQRKQALAALPRSYLLVSAELFLTGPTSDGVGVESFLTQVRQTSGKRPTLAMRLGAEAEPIEGWLKVRVGTYLEPSRFEDRGYRLHGTFGTDLRLFSWDAFGLFDEFTFRVGGAVDIAPRYFDWGISVGFWH